VLEKVKKEEAFTLPGEGREIRLSHITHEIPTALRNSINEVRADESKACLHIRALAHGFIQGLPAWKEAKERMEKRMADGKAEQAREVLLYDYEQISLFESILACAVNESRDEKQPRKAIDSLTLGVIVAVYMALRQRGMNIDHLMHGYLDMDRFKKIEVWDGVKPLYMTMKTPAKHDKANGAKHLLEMMHHRCPLRCPIAMLGLYFAYQFLQKKETLPTMEDWLSETMHKRPFIRLQSGAGASVTSFNGTVRENLALIGGPSRFTFKCLRNMGIAEAGEDWNMDRSKIVAGVSHAVHDTKYRSFDAAMLLTGAGYTGSNPEDQGAYSKAVDQVGPSHPL